ncbi:MAG: MFS transporter [Deltaproteobacteria bacterium]|nr:MFS transporter [Deltaproteobacteria bacterium]
MPQRKQLFIIFTTVFVDLIGFGIVIPLIGLYGKHYGASGAVLGALAAAYSLFQFIFAPVWGRLSDRFGRRPILLVTLAGQAVSYLLFGLAGNLELLFISRCLAGLFAGNIGTAMAYIADITTREDRARGMAVVGASFGIGFTLGPPLGGIAAAKLGLSAPGLIAAGLCAMNFLAAVVRLPESLPKELRRKSAGQSLSPVDFGTLTAVWKHDELRLLVFTFAVASFCFSNMEQPMPLLIQRQLGIPVEEAGYRAGMVLMAVGLMSALTQGVFVRRYGQRFGERRLMLIGLSGYVLPVALWPLVSSYPFYFLTGMMIGTANGLANPNMMGLISRNTAAHEQGAVLGLTQGLGSFGRVLGPMFGLVAFETNYRIPFFTAAALWTVLALLNRRPGPPPETVRQ